MISELLKELEPDHHRGRVATMISLGRRARSDSAAAGQLAELSRQGFYQRQLSLFGFLAANDGESLARMVRSDLSLRLRNRAIKGIAHVGSDAQNLGLLDDLPKASRQKLLRQLQRRARQQVIDDWLLTQPEPPLESLGYASPAVLQPNLARLLERGSVVEWKRLTRRHPEWAVSVFLQGQRDGLAMDRVRTVLWTLLKIRSGLCWKAWRQAVASGYETHQLPERELFALCPTEATEWALAQADAQEWFGRPPEPDWPFEKGTRRYSFAVCQALLEKGWLSLDYRWWTRRPATERHLLWADYRCGSIWEDGRLGAVWLRRLDAATRMTEARRQSKLAAVELEPRQQAEFFAMLGKDEGWEALRPFLTSPEVDTRALGVRGLVQLATYQPECLEAILPNLVARRNEADPVRAAFLEELSKLKPSCWTAAHLGPLDEILQALQDAADASAYSFRGAEALMLRLLPYHGCWAADRLGRLLRHWGQVSLSSWSVHLQLPGTAEALDEHLERTLADWFPRERHGPIFALFGAVGKALRRMPQVRARCVALCWSPQPEIARQALHALWQGAPDQARVVIPELLAADPSWVGELGVLDWLHRRRQDLLSPYLGGQVMAGKFASGRTEWVLWPSGKFWRWTPRQQARYAGQLEGLLADPERDFQALRRCVRALAQLTDVPPSGLEKAAALSESRQAVRDEALRCLARVEDGQGVPALTAALEDERARIAIYALRSTILQMPAPEALLRLKAITSPKVTVAKEVARLLGDLPGGLGVDALLQRLAGDLHRDVRLATLRGLWDHLDRDDVWAPFWEAAESPDPAIGKALSATTSAHLGRSARQKLERLLIRLLKHPSRLVRWQVLDRLAKAPMSPDEMDLILACRGFLSEPREGMVAAGALYQAFLSRPEAWATLLRETISEPAALQKLVNTIGYHRLSNGNPASYPQMIEATLQSLAGEAGLVALRLELIATVGPLDIFLAAVEAEIEDEAGLEILFCWGLLLIRVHYRLDQSTYNRIADRWKHHSRAVLRRLCLEALLAHARAFGWTPFNRQQLHDFSLDSSALVRAKAQFVFPPPEG